MKRLDASDADRVREALLLYPFEPIELDVNEWLADSDNIAMDIDGNIGLFQKDAKALYSPHYFFKDRGKRAKEISIEMLHCIFGDYQAEAIRGLTPVKNRAAVWMTRHLGVKDYGTVETWIGDCIIFIMTRKEFYDKYGDPE
jgi:hypothetical protein